jgi:hypothetical protein
VAIETLTDLHCSHRSGRRGSGLGFTLGMDAFKLFMRPRSLVLRTPHS